MLYLKQATAAQTVLIGPFVDDTDGATAETALTIANTDIRLSANGGNLTAKNSGGGTHDENGWYQITLDATDTATVGTLQLHCKVAGALMVHHEFTVLEENVYAAIFASSAALGTDIASILADTNELQTDDIPGTLAGLNDLSAAQVNAEVVDALATDTYAEPGQGAPGATVSLAAKIGYLYKAWRNKKDNDGTTTNLYADDTTTVDQKQATSESGGTVTKGEWATGP